MKNNPVFKSTKTTVAGVLGALAILSSAITILLDGDPLTMPDWNSVVGGILMALGLISARDGDKTSEDVGLKKEQA